MKAIMLCSSSLFFVHVALKLCNAAVLQEAFVINSRVLRIFPACPTWKLPSFLSSSRSKNALTLCLYISQFYLFLSLFVPQYSPDLLTDIFLCLSITNPKIIHRPSMGMSIAQHRGSKKTSVTRAGGGHQITKEVRVDKWGGHVPGPWKGQISSALLWWWAGRCLSISVSQQVLVMPSMLALRFLDNVLPLVILVLVSHPFIHMNIAKFSRDLEMTWVKRGHIWTRLRIPVWSLC